MSKLNYTKGKWQVLPEEVDKDYIRVRGTCIGGRYKIANVPTPTYDNVHERESDETRANARLIAAAPEMLEALIESVIFIENVSEGMDISNLKHYQNKVAIIEKATGKSWEEVVKAGR